MPPLYTKILKPGEEGLIWDPSTTGSRLCLKSVSLQATAGGSPVNLTLQKASTGSEEVTLGVLGLKNALGLQLDLTIEEKITLRARGKSNIHLVGVLLDGTNESKPESRPGEIASTEKPKQLANGTSEKLQNMASPLKDLPASEEANVKPVTTPVPFGSSEQASPEEGSALLSTGKKKRRRQQKKKGQNAAVDEPQPDDAQAKKQKPDKEQVGTPVTTVSNASLESMPTPTPTPTSGGTPKRKDTRRFTNGLVIHNKSYGQPDGKVALKGKKLFVSYEGRLSDTGEVFDKTKGGKHFEFVLGAGQVIKGWDKGLEQMRVGDTRLLTIPPSMAYGEQGVPPKIPGKSTLIFDVTLHDVK